MFLNKMVIFIKFYVICLLGAVRLRTQLRSRGFEKEDDDDGPTA